MVSVSPKQPDALVSRARAMAADGHRRLLGIAGPPGSGKSTLATAVADALGPSTAVVVGMDGFHLAQQELVRLGRADRKGAPDTFDRAGFVALLRRLAATDEEITYAPLFRRDLDEPIGGAVPVVRSTPLVITEGNYLLLWPDVRALLDDTWYLDVAPDERHRRLIARRVAHGVGEEEGRRWTFGSDEANARTVAATARFAQLVVRG